jgi:hypothetical protein
MAKPDSIECPPFPTLDWDDFFWSAPYTLPAWAGFQSRGGAYCSTDSSNVSGGTINLVVSTDAETRSPPTPEQVAALEFLRDNDSAITAMIVQRIYDEYPAIREQFADFLEPEELDEDMPLINAADDLRRLIGLGNVHIHNTSKDGVAYIGFDLCFSLFFV